MAFKNDLISDCRIVSGSLFNRPARLLEIEKILLNQKLSKKLIDEIEKPLKNIIDQEIGGRWSSEYKIPVFLNMMRNGLNDIQERGNKND